MRSGVRRSERMAGHRPLRQGWGGLLFLALALAGIRAAGAAAAAAAPSPPRLRLGDAARPIRCALDLTVRPASDSFTGMVDLDLQLRRPTALLWLNAADLMIREAHAQSGGRSLPARVVPGGDDFAGFAFAHPLGPGPLRLHVAYQGKMPEKESGGLFRRHAGSDWYAFTQFEPIDARRAFPCFDEPGFKQPWQLTLHVPKTVTALSNTPIAAETDEAEGMKQVRFAATKPLPSYLVAFAVGPFESVAAGKAGMRGTAIRVITPRGRAKEAHYAAQTAPQLLALLERCFGIPYPFDKLDLLAVPDFPMAMENPGLIWARPAPRRRPGRSRSLSSTRRAGTRSAPAPFCARPVRSGRWPARAAPTGSSPMRDRPAIIASSTGAICWPGSCGPAPPSRWRSGRAW